jgi:hypothetical protein
LRSHEDDIEALSIAPTTGGYCIYAHTGIGYLLNDYRVKTKEQALLIVDVIQQLRLVEHGVQHRDKRHG